MINKFQQGGKQDAIMQFVQGLAQTLQTDPNQIIQIAQQNPDALKAAVQTYQQTQDMNQAAQVFQQTLQQGVQAARHGAKLNYIKFLKHQCAEDEELYYYKRGGSVDCGCKKKQIMQDGGKTNQSTVDKFKSSREKNNKKEEGWDKRGNYIVSKKGIAERKKQLNSNKNEEGQADPNKKKIPAKCGGSKMKLQKKGGEVCPKCGKVHAAGMGCAVAKFKMRGGIL